MKYISTRGQTAPMDFSDVLLMGLAPDGGLMLPEHYPNIDSAVLDEWRTLSYPQLAMAIMQRFATDIPVADLQDLIERTYTAEVFGSEEIVPVRKLEDNLYILGLSNGPTLAFKDVAMQFLGNAFEYVLKKKMRVLLSSAQPVVTRVVRQNMRYVVKKILKSLCCHRMAK